AIDGVEIAGTFDSMASDGTDRDYGVFVAADNAVLKNSVLDGTGQGDVRPFGTLGGLSGLDVDHNYVHDWEEGAYIVSGTAGTIDHNLFENNGNQVLTESTATVISHNTFVDSVGAQVGALPFDPTVDVSTYVLSDNTFSGSAREVVIYPNAPGSQDITGTAFNDTFQAHDGNDHLVGGAGTDTAVYAGTLSAGNFHYDAGTDTWTVNAGGEGTDTLSGIELVTGADPAGAATGRFLLVDEHGSFTSIQAAVDAAQDGDTIVVAAGTYNESVNVTKAVTIVGANGGLAGDDAARGAGTGSTGGGGVGRARVMRAGRQDAGASGALGCG